MKVSSLFRSRCVLRVVGGIVGLSLAGVVMMTPGLFAQESKPAEQPAGTSASPASGGEYSITQTAPATPVGMPVPNLPIVSKAELEGGVVAEDMKIGDGKEVKPGAVVTVHYHGTLASNGNKFDSTYERSSPATMPLTMLIKGWQVGIPGMKIGGVRKLTIPAAMAWGDKPFGEAIPASSDVVFIMEVLDVANVEEVKVGEVGDAVGQQFVACTVCTIKNELGETVFSADAKNPYMWLPGEFNTLSMAMHNMKVGGKRIIDIPKSMNEADPRIPAGMLKYPTDTALKVEVELVGLRNLQ